MSCEYIGPDKTPCNRDVLSGNRCPFHTEVGVPGRPNDNSIKSMLNDLIKKMDGKWDGFIFPAEFIIGEVGRSQELKFSISARKAKFGSFSINYCDCEGIDFRESLFQGDFQFISVQILEKLQLSKIIIEGFCAFYSVKVKGCLDASGAHFKGAFRISGQIDGKSDFNNAIFEKSTDFSGQRNIKVYGETSTISLINSVTSINKTDVVYEGCNNSKGYKIKSAIHSGLRFIRAQIIDNATFKKVKKRILNVNNYFRKPRNKDNSVEIIQLFEGEANFGNVVFNDKKNTLFKGVDLSCAKFLRTDVRDIKFIGVNWYQDQLKRNGLYEDVQLRLGLFDNKSRMNELPLLEYTYRYIRNSLESVNDYVNAGDFYVGEMDAARYQLKSYESKFFSVLAIYNLISRYGTSPFRAFLWFILFAFIHTYLSRSEFDYQFDEFYKLISSFPCFLFVEEKLNSLLNTAEQNFLIFLKNFLYSIQVMTLQKSNLIINTNQDDIKMINVLFSIIGPVIVSLFVLSFRGKIKRH